MCRQDVPKEVFLPGAIHDGQISGIAVYAGGADTLIEFVLRRDEVIDLVKSTSELQWRECSPRGRCRYLSIELLVILSKE